MHIIEVIDLVGTNSSGLADPIVFVEVMGQRQHTRVQYNKTSAFYDEVFYFNFPGLKKEQIAEAHVTVSVYDSQWWGLMYVTTGIYNVRPGH